MSLNAVQQQIQSYLAGLPSQGYPGALDARVEQPVGEFAKLGTPLVFIWGAAGHETRLALPRPDATVGRGPGWKQDAHTVSLWIFALAQASDPDRAWKFPVLIRTVCKTLASVTPMPAPLTDPQTGETSTLLNLGEEFTWDYDIDRTVADQRMVRNVCRLDVTALEEFNA